MDMAYCAFQTSVEKKKKGQHPLRHVTENYVSGWHTKRCKKRPLICQVYIEPAFSTSDLFCSISGMHL